MVAPSSLCDGCGQDDISCSSGSIEYEDCEDGLCGGSTTEGTTTEGSIKVFWGFFLFAFHLLSGLEPFLSISQSVSLGERPVVILWDRMQDLRTKDEETKADRMR